MQGRLQGDRGLRRSAHGREGGGSAAPNNKPPAEPPFYTEPLFLGIVLVTFLVVAYQITRPATHERRRLQRLVDDQREDARVHQQIAQMLQQSS